MGVPRVESSQNNFRHLSSVAVEPPVEIKLPKSSPFQTPISVTIDDIPMPPDSLHLGHQVVWLFLIAVPIASIAWTVTHEEIFKEPRKFCEERSERCRSLLKRKFFYLFTCEFCFSHYVTAFFLWLTHFKLLMDDWRGYVIALFAAVWIANAYMSLYNRLRVDIRSGKAEADVKTIEKEQKEKRAERLSAKIEALEYDGAS